MAEDKRHQGQQMEKRLRELALQWSQGRTTLQEIVGLSEEELYAVAVQGYHLFLQGKTESARVLFEGLVAIDPRSAYYYKALGAIYWRLKEPTKSIKQFTYAIRVAPRDVASYVNRAEVYVALRDFGSARKDLHQAIKHAGPFDEALVRKARAISRMIPRE